MGAWRLRPSWRKFAWENSAALDSVILLAYVLPYSLVVLATSRPTMAEQMLLPVLPVFAAWSGLGAAWLSERLALGRLGNTALVVGLVLMPLVFSVPATRLLTQPDTRQVMQAWVVDHLPHGATIHLAGAYNLALDPADFTVTQNFGDVFPTLEEMRATGADYLILSDALYFDALQAEGDPQGVASTRQYLAQFEALPRLAWISRPTWPGSASVHGSVRIWHDPALTIYYLK